MPDLVPQHYTTEFATNWIQRTQQTKARLDAFVVDESFNGERKRWNRLAAQNSRLRTERKGPTVVSEASSDLRWAYNKSYDLANTLDRDDAQNLGNLVLPTSDYVASHAAAYNRDKDDAAWTAALNPAMTGENGTSSVVLPPSQQIAAGGTGLTMVKLLQANEILEGADLEDESPRVLCVTAQQLTNLLNSVEVKSADYNTVKALVNGQIDSFMGFKFVKIKRLTKVTTTRSCVGWVKGAVKRFIGERFSDISKRSDLSYATQIYSAWSFGAARVYDEGVVQIDCTEGLFGAV
jgi:hypothetical protein